MGQTADVELGIISHVSFGVTAANEQADREFFLGLSGRHHENLLDSGQTIQCHRPQTAVIDRHFTPAHNLKALLCETLFKRCTTGSSLVFIRVQEHLPYRKQVPWLLAEGSLGGFLQKCIRALDQEATTIAGLSVCSDTTSVGHAGQRLDGSLQQLVAGLALHVGNQTESTVVPEFIGMIQTCHHKRSLA